MHGNRRRIRLIMYIRYIFFFLIVALLLVFLAFQLLLVFPAFQLLLKHPPAPVVSVHPPVHMVSADHFPDISDGHFVFDVQRPGGNLKNEAAKSLRDGNPQAALAEWNLVLQEDPTDAEALIDQENQNILSKGTKHFVIAIAIYFGSESRNSAIIGNARDILQGVYVEQNNYNMIQRAFHHSLRRSIRGSYL